MACGDEQFATSASVFAFGSSGFFGGGFAINGEPTWDAEDFAIGLESVIADAGYASGDFEFGRREKDGDEAAQDHVEQFLFGFG